MLDGQWGAGLSLIRRADDISNSSRLELLIYLSLANISMTFFAPEESEAYSCPSVVVRHDRQHSLPDPSEWVQREKMSLLSA